MTCRPSTRPRAGIVLRAFGRFASGAWADLCTLVDLGPDRTPARVNASGRVSGYMARPRGRLLRGHRRAALLLQGIPGRRRPPGPDEAWRHLHGTRMNSRGDVAGDADIEAGGPAIGFFSPGPGQPTPIGTLPGGGRSSACAIDDLARVTVVGRANLQAGHDSPRHAVRWNGSLKAIGALPDCGITQAHGMNGHKSHAGYCVKNSDGPQHALRFGADGVVALESEVDDLGDWRLKSAESISNAGVIVGRGVCADGARGFMRMQQ